MNGMEAFPMLDYWCPDQLCILKKQQGYTRGVDVPKATNNTVFTKTSSPQLAFVLLCSIVILYIDHFHLKSVLKSYTSEWFLSAL